MLTTLAWFALLAASTASPVNFELEVGGVLRSYVVSPDSTLQVLRESLRADIEDDSLDVTFLQGGKVQSLGNKLDLLLSQDALEIHVGDAVVVMPSNSLPSGEAKAKVFGLGLSKTGTSSLTSALTALGYETIHNDKTLINFLTDRPFDDHHYDPIDSAVDLPTALYYEELMKAYPDAKFILTVRDEEDWFASAQRYFAELTDFFGGKLPFRTEKLLEVAYGSITPTEEWKIRFRAHNENVKRVVPSSRLLVLDVTKGESYKALCPFLGSTDGPCLNPSVAEFPHDNAAGQLPSHVERCNDENKLENAFALYLHLDDSENSTAFFQGALVLISSLRETGHKSDVVFLYTGQMSPTQKQALSTFSQVRIAKTSFLTEPNILGRSNELDLTGVYRASMRALSLTEYKRVMFLDSDMIVTKNMDAFFDVDEFFLGQEGRISPINSGWFVFTPSCQAFYDVNDVAQTKFTPELGWMDVGEFEWPHNGMHDWNFHSAQADQGLLWYYYFVHQSGAVLYPRGTMDEYLTHFVGSYKPWFVPRNMVHLLPESYREGATLWHRHMDDIAQNFRQQGIDLETHAAELDFSETEIARVLQANPYSLAPTAPTAPTSGSPTVTPASLTPTSTSPTGSPTPSPTAYPTDSPTTLQPTLEPTINPTINPTVEPTLSPTTIAPTLGPQTIAPSASPTTPTTSNPTLSPTPITLQPTAVPTTEPTVGPTAEPTTEPTTVPTSLQPTFVPTSLQPTNNPTASPQTTGPTSAPTKLVTSSPTTPTTNSPSTTPTTARPTVSPTVGPSAGPTITPTSSPLTSSPTVSPTPQPTLSPTTEGTDMVCEYEKTRLSCAGVNPGSGPYFVKVTSAIWHAPEAFCDSQTCPNSTDVTARVTAIFDNPFLEICPTSDSYNNHWRTVCTFDDITNEYLGVTDDPCPGIQKYLTLKHVCVDQNGNEYIPPFTLSPTTPTLAPSGAPSATPTAPTSNPPTAPTAPTASPTTLQPTISPTRSPTGPREIGVCVDDNTIVRISCVPEFEGQTLAIEIINATYIRAPALNTCGITPSLPNQCPVNDCTNNAIFDQRCNGFSSCQFRGNRLRFDCTNSDTCDSVPGKTLFYWYRCVQLTTAPTITPFPGVP